MAAARRPAPGPLAAFVLHSWDWSETSLIVELFTRDRGRVAVVAKGAKRPYSQLRAVLVPFQRLQAQVGRAHADESDEVLPLRGAERSEGPPMPAGAALFSGFYLNELLIKLLARLDPHPALWDAYAEAVARLQGRDESGLQPVLRAFELTLLREIGVLPDLHQVTLTVQAVQDEVRYTLHPEAGVVATALDGGLQGRQLVALEAGLASGQGDALRAAVGPCAAALRAPLREVLHYHLGSPRLSTRQVMAELQRLLTPDTSRPS